MPKGKEKMDAFNTLLKDYRLSEYDFHADIARHRQASDKGHLLGINEGRTRSNGTAQVIDDPNLVSLNRF